jgi:hypothetical protein
MNIVHAGEVGELRQINTTVVYDRVTGEIIHLHHTAVFERALTPSEDEMVREALTQAEQARADLSRVSSLFLGSRLLNPDYEYRVDPDTRTLIEVSRSAREGLDRIPRRR